MTIKNKNLQNRFSANLPDLAAHLIFWPLISVFLALDLWSKAAVFKWLSQGRSGSVSLIDGFLWFVRAENPGAAFGIAANQRYLLTLVSVFALIAIFIYFFFGTGKNRLLQTALGLLTAGVCGNLYDRLFNNGMVRDFIDVVYWPGKHWPAFNVADSCLCIGVSLVFISSFFTAKSARKHDPQQK